MDKLSTKNVDKLGITACYVESVDKLSTFFVDNLPRCTIYVDNVDKLSTKIVDKFGRAAYYVDNVDKLSTKNVDKGKSGKKLTYPQLLWISRWKNVQMYMPFILKHFKMNDF